MPKSRNEITDSAASIYWQGTLWLLDTYCYALSPGASGYTYAFDEALVAEFWESSGGGITSSGEAMFPPVSEVLGGNTE